MRTLFTLLICLNAALAQYGNTEADEKPVFQWPNGVKCAVSLTFDDARLSQIDKGIPLLNQYNIKATFYITPHNMDQRLDGWRQAVQEGHEIGNHTVSHPCTGNYPFSLDNALEDYTKETIAGELDAANRYILENLGVRAVSFAYPCGQKFYGRGEQVMSYVPLVAERFLTGRGWLDEDSNDPWVCDMAQLMGMESDGKSFDELKALVDKAARSGRWLILAGHEMRESGSQTTYLSSLESLCRYASDPANGIWIDTVEHVAEYILNNR